MLTLNERLRVLHLIKTEEYCTLRLLRVTVIRYLETEATLT